MGKNNKGFTLVEMLVAVFIFAIITVPILLTFYIGATQVDKQSGNTKEVSVVRETLKLIRDDLERYASLATRVESNNYNITKLIIRDDENLDTKPKRLIYVYDNDSRVLLRIVDNLQSVILSEEQLGDKYYKESQREKYDIEENSPVKFTKDNLLNTISVYLRIKTTMEAEPQEDFYLHNILEEGRRVIKFYDNGYIKDIEKFNFRDSSFTIETYFKLDETNTPNLDDRCLFNMIDSRKESKIKVYISSGKLGLYMDDVLIGEISLGGLDTTGVWRKLVITYDDSKKEIIMYVSKKDNPAQFESKVIHYDTDKIFYDKGKGSIKISEIYLGNESNNNNNNFAGCLYMYEPRIWQKKLYTNKEDINKEYLTKRLIGNEDSLMFYIKDDYRKVFYDNKVVCEIVNVVSNKVLEQKEVEVSYEIQTEESNLDYKTKVDNISKLIG